VGESEEVICALHDFREHGEKAIAKVRRTQPAAYLKILALLVPREHKVEHSNPLKKLTDEELEAMVEYLKAALEAEAQRAKVIEGEAEVIPSLPAPGSGGTKMPKAQGQPLQKSLNLSGAMSVYLTVCWMFLWPR
jgi:2-oxoglutarate dehydrogenase complex dehydrogenase (E1) component-like enzyme